MQNGTLISDARRKSREAIHAVIDAHVRGPVELITGTDLRDLRRHLRAAMPFSGANHYEVRIWRQEVKAALGFPIKINARRRGEAINGPVSVMPAMREWAERNGLDVKK